MDYLDYLYGGLVFKGFLIVVLLVIFLFWFERRLMAKIHTRIGPLYTGPQGILQPIADILKLLWKEKITPAKADKALFNIIPPLFPLIAITTLVFIPFWPNDVLILSEYSLLFVVALLSFIPVLIVAVSWASSNRYSLIGGLRAAASLIVYEIPIMIVIASIAALSGSLNLVTIVEKQAEMWYIIPGILGAIVFFIAMLAETERIPFDIPTAEQEIVVGWETEFSGSNFVYVVLAKYAEVIVFSALYTDLFLGGWLGPFHPLINFFIKFFVVIIIMVAIRAAYSRLRMDQLLRFGWKLLIPLAFVNIFVVKLVLIYV